MHHPSKTFTPSKWNSIQSLRAIKGRHLRTQVVRVFINRMEINMNLKPLGKLVFASLGIIALASANAAPTTWTFSGTVNSGSPHAGQAVTGWLQVDLSVLPPGGTDGSTFLDGSKTFNYSAGSGQSPISGEANIGSWRATVLGVGGSLAMFDYAKTSVQKNYQEGSPLSRVDQFSVTGVSQFITSPRFEITLYTKATTDGNQPSGIFDNATYANPMLDLTQPVNWFTAGTLNGGRLVTGSFTTEDFTLTSIAVSSVPEVSSVLLLVIGLVVIRGFTASREVDRCRVLTI